MSLDISPADGVDDVPPDAEVTVRGSAGRLTDVQVIDGSGDYVEVYYDADRTVWTATENLRLGERYTAYAVGEGATGAVRDTSTFRTLDIPAAKQLHIASVAPADGATVGIAHPPHRHPQPRGEGPWRRAGCIGGRHRAPGWRRLVLDR